MLVSKDPYVPANGTLPCGVSCQEERRFPLYSSFVSNWSCDSRLPLPSAAGSNPTYALWRGGLFGILLNQLFHGVWLYHHPDAVFDRICDPYPSGCSCACENKIEVTFILNISSL